MKRIEINSFQDFIRIVEDSTLTETDLTYPKKRIVLFRGQNNNYKLLPAIARNDSSKNTKDKEVIILEELRLRSFGIIEDKELKDDWDWLVFAQHFGLHTRLLDWSSNPLVALFFACSDYSKIKVDSYVYMFIGGEEFLVDKKKDNSPFEINATKILRPKPNNKRIVAQSGWFTVHRYSQKDKRFVNIESHGGFKDLVFEIKIPSNRKETFMEILNKMGINFQSLFPDEEGLCRQINWENRPLSEH